MQTCTPAGVALPLPAQFPPLYFIGAEQKQVFRLDAAAHKIVQITSEAKPVSDLDVSPVDGSLVYVSDNCLIVTDAFGRNRQILVRGEPLNEQQLTGKEYWTKIISSPRWSPDGKQIAFGLAGVNLISVGADKPQLVQPDDPNDFTAKSVGSRRFDPVSWSPDGTRLLLQFRWYVESGGHAVKNLKDGRLVQMKSQGGAYSSAFWDAQSALVYRTTAVTGLGGDNCSDLHTLNVDTGASQLLLASTDDRNQGKSEDPSKPCALITGAYQASDSNLYFFLIYTTFEELLPPQNTPPKPTTLGMYRAGPDASGRVLLRQDIQNVQSALWAPDASSAVVITGKESWIDHDNHLVYWVSTDKNKPIVALPINGSDFRWGK